MKYTTTAHRNSVSYPPRVLEHVARLYDGSYITVIVSPSETFGCALSRLRIDPIWVTSVSVDGPIDYEPDFRDAAC
jgi:hypothetical protein